MIFNNSSGAPLPELANPATVADVSAGKDFIDGNGEQRTGTAPNYTKLLMAQNIIPTSPASVDLLPEDFGALTAVGGLVTWNNNRMNHPLRSAITPTLPDGVYFSFGNTQYLANFKYLKCGQKLKVGQGAFSYADLSVVDVDGFYQPGQRGFANTSVSKMIIRSESVQEAGGYFLQSTPIANGNGYIFVPPDLVETYKTKTNWVPYANQFRALYIAESAAERDAMLADSSIADGSMIVWDGGTFDKATLTGTMYTVKETAE